MAVVAAVYMRVFLPDSVVGDGLTAPFMSKEKPDLTKLDGESTRNGMQIFKSMPSLKDMVSLLKTRSVYFISFFLPFVFVSLNEIF